MSSIIDCEYCGRPTYQVNSKSTCPFMGHEYYLENEGHPLGLDNISQMRKEIRILQLTLHNMADKLSGKKDERDE